MKFVAIEAEPINIFTVNDFIEIPGPGVTESFY